jgi:predicted Rossmann fold flavoprotein
VPLTLPRDHFLCGLSGVTTPATFTLRGPTGKRLASFTDSTLCTHFGLSGPGVLDVSRHWLDAEPGSVLHANWLPGTTTESVDSDLAELRGESPARFLSRRVPERLARGLCEHAGVDPAAPAHALTRERRRVLARAVTDLALPITGDRGYNFAEVTAGGVPLSELRLETMESRVCPGLHLCGEICDVDGRIGGYNFQWAWASGHVAGAAAGQR